MLTVYYVFYFVCIFASNELKMHQIIKKLYKQERFKVQKYTCGDNVSQTTQNIVLINHSIHLSY